MTSKFAIATALIVLALSATPSLAVSSISTSGHEGGGLSRGIVLDDKPPALHACKHGEHPAPHAKLCQ